MILITDFLKKYKNVTVFSGKSLEICDKGIVYVTGDSGSGKTTLINCLSGLDKFTKGNIYINNKKVDNLKNYCSFVYQDYQLIDKWSVKKNLTLARNDVTDEEIEKVLKILNIYSVKDNLAYDISAGQKQRTAVARALLQKRQIIILDEPFSNLDKKNTKEIQDILKKLSEDILIIIVSHQELPENYYNQKITIEDGKIYSSEVLKTTNNIRNVPSNKLSFKNIISLCFLFMKKVGILYSRLFH